MDRPQLGLRRPSKGGGQHWHSEFAHCSIRSRQSGGSGLVARSSLARWDHRFYRRCSSVPAGLGLQ
jgi:hypothetical protein